MDDRQSRTSRFVTLPGLLLLLFFAVLAIYFHAAAVGLFLMFIFLLCLGARIWSRGVLARVEVSVKPLMTVCHAGGQLRLEITVKNRSFFPLVWLDVILPSGPRVLFRSEGEAATGWYALDGEAHAQIGIRERFVWLLWQQEIQWEERLITFRRGTAEIPYAYLQAGDGFGLSAGARKLWLPAPVRLLVYPRIVPVRIQPFLRVAHEAAASRRGQSEDTTILRGSRPYLPGDPVRRINWRMLAASGHMEVKLYQTVMPACAAFVPDLESFVHMEKRSCQNGMASEELVPVLCEKELEQMLSLIASCMRELAEHGMLCALALPACAGHAARVILPENGGNVLDACMEALAMLDYDGKETQFPYEEFLLGRHRIGDIYLCTMTDGKSTYGKLNSLYGFGHVRRISLKKGVDTNCLYADDLTLEAL